MPQIKGIQKEGEQYVLTLTRNDLKAINAAIYWAEMLENTGKLEIYDYQKQSFAILKRLCDFGLYEAEAA